MDIISSLSKPPAGWGWCLAAAFTVTLAVYGWHPISRWRYRHIPGPPPTWLFGNLVSIVRMGLPMFNQMTAAKYGPVFKVWQGGVVFIVVEDPVAARSINMRNHDRPQFLSSFGGGGKYWQSLRQAWASMFTAASLRAYGGLFNASAERLVDVLAAKAKSGEPAEMLRLMGCLTMECVGSAAFGTELRALEGGSLAIGVNATAISFDEADDQATQLQKAAAVEFGTLGGHKSPYTALGLLFPDAAPLIRWVATRLPDAALRKWLQGRRIMRRICYSLIAEQAQSLQPQADSGDAAHDGPTDNLAAGDAAAGLQSSGGRAAAPDGELASEDTGRAAAEPVGRGLIHHLLAAESKLIQRPLTDMEIASQVNNFLLAGHETTAAALAFTVYHIASNPAAEARLLAEVDAFGRHAVPTVDDLARFPYLEAVLCESLRLTPPGAFGSIRVAREDFEVCGLTVRKGWFLNTAQYSFHNNPKYWAEPERFRPERLLTKTGSRAAAFAPFGDGGRQCVGMRFAKAASKIALIRLFQRFTLALVGGPTPLQLKTTISMSPKSGVLVLVRPRP